MSSSAYAGFLLRLLAFVVDTIILFVGMMILRIIFDVPMTFGYHPLVPPTPLTPGVIGFNLTSTLLIWLYYALFESSKWQATLGKQLVKIKVTDIHGSRISFGRATGRHFAKILSTFIIFIGYIMIIFTEKKQGLHDIIAGTLVVRD